VSGRAACCSCLGLTGEQQVLLSNSRGVFPRELLDSRLPLAVAEQDHQLRGARRDFFRAEMLFTSC
jgi:hypothetical protein